MPQETREIADRVSSNVVGIRRRSFRRTAILGAGGVLAACLLIALVVPWADNYQRPPSQTSAESTHLLVASAPATLPALVNSVDALPQMVATAEALPAPVAPKPSQIDPKLTVRAGGFGQPAEPPGAVHPSMSALGSGLDREAGDTRWDARAKSLVRKMSNSTRRAMTPLMTTVSCGQGNPTLDLFD